MYSQSQHNSSATLIPKNAHELKQIVDKKRIVVIKFHAEWCGPCKQTAGQFEQMSRDLTNNLISFVSLDIDKDSSMGGNWGQLFQVNGVPCYKFYIDGEMKPEFTQMGADLNPVYQIIKENYQLISHTTPV